MAMIECRKCKSPYCDGCNIYTLAKTLHKGELNCLMADSHSIARTPESLRPKWISVEDRLPDETKDEYVLVVCDYYGKITVETRKMWHIDSVVTHWMPMPEPPKE